MSTVRLNVVCLLLALLASCVQSQSSAPKVQLGLYYESLCPDCQVFFQDQLGPVYSKVKDIMELELVPYGNAEEKQNPDGSWNFTCQHGPRECAGNLVETCALRLLPNMETALPFVMCLEASDKPETEGPQCAEKLGLDYSPIQSCVTSSQGNQWQHENAVKTDHLYPEHEYVPWITLNGAHSEVIQEKAQRNLLKLICDTYTGKPPAACGESWLEMETNAV